MEFLSVLLVMFMVWSIIENSKYKMMFILNIILIYMEMLWSSGVMVMSWGVIMDKLSSLLNILSIWLVFLSMSVLVLEENKKDFLILSCLGGILILSFSVSSFFYFFIFFEISLIPIIYMVFMSGNQMERIKAGMYMLLFTMAGSLPLLVMIFKKSLQLSVIMDNKVLWKEENIMFLMILAFLIKLPIYFVHLWLPKAHVEAPVVGSMMLAGIMLKLGGYGIYRMMVMMMSMGIMKIIIVVWSLIGALYIGMLCMNQVDLKMLVAYSSVCHMSYVVSGYLTGSKMGENGALLMMLGHGVCSSVLFFSVNLLYKRGYTRNMMMLKGMQNFYPFFSLMWFLSCVVNLGVPFTMNFLSELMVMMSVIMWSNVMIVPMMLVSFMSAFYSLYMYMSIQYGKMIFLKSNENLKSVDYSMMVMHLLIVFLFIFKMENFLM